MDTIDTSPGPAPEVIIIGADNPGVRLIFDMFQMMGLMAARADSPRQQPGDMVLTKDTTGVVFIDEMDDGVEELFSGEYKFPRMPVREFPTVRLAYESEPIHHVDRTYGKASRNAIHRMRKKKR